MTTKTLKSAVRSLEKVLVARQGLVDSISADLAKLADTQARIEAFIMASEDKRLDSVPEIVADKAPFVAFTATEKTIGSCITAAMTTKHERIVELENSIKAEVDALKAQYELLEGYALQHLEREGTGSTKGIDGGRVESRTITRYSIVDKTQFVKWATENGAESELTITVRPNSKFMAKQVEDAGELPAGISMTRNKIACFVRN